MLIWEENGADARREGTNLLRVRWPGPSPPSPSSYPRPSDLDLAKLRKEAKEMVKEAERFLSPTFLPLPLCGREEQGAWGNGAKNLSEDGAYV